MRSDPCESRKLGLRGAQIFLQSTWVELHEPHEQLLLDDCTTYPLGQLEPHT